MDRYLGPPASVKKSGRACMPLHLAFQWSSPSIAGRDPAACCCHARHQPALAEGLGGSMLEAEFHSVKSRAKWQRMDGPAMPSVSG
eukprot:351058-Chlamydomonas_euryale.AAC.6